MPERRRPQALARSTRSLGLFRARNENIRRVLAIGDVSRDPMEGYFRARDRAVRIGFQEVPGTAITFDFRCLGPRDAGYGDLFFENPKGKWEKGIYTFSIQNKDVDVKLPIPIGIEGELERVK